MLSRPNVNAHVSTHTSVSMFDFRARIFSRLKILPDIRLRVAQPFHIHMQHLARARTYPTILSIRKFWRAFVAQTNYRKKCKNLTHHTIIQVYQLCVCKSGSIANDFVTFYLLCRAFAMPCIFSLRLLLIFFSFVLLASVAIFIESVEWICRLCSVVCMYILCVRSAYE